MFGGDSTAPDYAPHMWLGEQFIHNSGKVVQVGDWWYRAGRLNDETIIAERWKGKRFGFQPGDRTDYEMVPSDQIPEEVRSAMESISRVAQKAFQQDMERRFGQPQ